MDSLNSTVSLEKFFSPLLSGLGTELPGILLTLLILVSGLFIARTVKTLVTKVFAKATWLKRIEKSEDRDNISKNAGQLAYYVVLLNVLLVVLERMNITSVLDPLKDLANQFMASLPRVIGAAIIFYAGWIIAKLAASLVELAASKLDTILEEKGFEMDFQTSKFLSAFVLGAVLLPITVAGFEFLSISAISKPAIAMITEFMSAVPNIVGAGLILLASYVIGRFVIYMLTGLLDGMNVDAIPQKMGFASVLPKDQSFKDTIGSTCMFFIMLTATTAAIDKLEISIISQIFSKMLHFGGGILLGGIILMIGSFLANAAFDKINITTKNTTIANICRFAILGLVLAMGLKSMGLADNIVNMAFAFTFGSIGVATAIAFGVGGKDAAKSLTMNWVGKTSTGKNSSPSKQTMNI